MPVERTAKTKAPSNCLSRANTPRQQAVSSTNRDFQVPMPGVLKAASRSWRWRLGTLAHRPKPAPVTMSLGQSRIADYPNLARKPRGAQAARFCMKAGKVILDPSLIRRASTRVP